MKNLILSPINPDDLIELVARRTAELIRTQSNSETDEDELMTRQATADLLKINVATLWRWTNRGRIKSYGMGGRVYYKRSEVLESLTDLK